MGLLRNLRIDMLLIMHCLLMRHLMSSILGLLLRHVWMAMAHTMWRLLLNSSDAVFIMLPRLSILHITAIVLWQILIRRLHLHIIRILLMLMIILAHVVLLVVVHICSGLLVWIILRHRHSLPTTWLLSWVSLVVIVHVWLLVALSSTILGWSLLRWHWITSLWSRLHLWHRHRILMLLLIAIARTSVHMVLGWLLPIVGLLLIVLVIVIGVHFFKF